MTHISSQHLSIRLRPRPAVSQHDAIFSSDAIFSGESLLLDVNFGPKISRCPEISRRLTASAWVSEDNLSAAGASTWVKHVHVQRESPLSRLYQWWSAVSLSNSRWRTGSPRRGECSATNVLKIGFCAKGVLAPVHLFFFLWSKTNPKYKSFYVIFSDSKTVVLR